MSEQPGVEDYGGGDFAYDLAHDIPPAAGR